MRRALKKTYQVLFLLIFTVVMVRAIMSMADQSKLATGILNPFLALFFLIRPGRRSSRSFSYTKCWIIVQCVSLAAMLAEMYVMELKLSWDWRLLIETAHQYTMGLDVSDNLRYFAVNSNNRFWLACLVWLFRVAHKLCPSMTELQQYKRLSMLLSGTMTQLTIWLVYRTARKLFSERRAFLTGLFAALFLPFYLYAQHAYTDVPGMFGITLAFFFYVKLKKDQKRKKLFLALLGLTVGFVFKIKVIIAILLIAILIEEALTTRKGKDFLQGLLITLAALLLAVSCANFVTKKTVVISDEMLERYEFPITHFVMMGLKGKGGYSDKEVQKTKKHETYEERVEYNLRVIRKRLKKLGPMGLLEHIVVRKMGYTWGNSCLAGNDYATRYPLRQTVLWELLSLKGKYHWILLIFTWPYYILILLGILFSAIAALREKTLKTSVFDVGRLTILGLTLFLFIWECNSRYLLSVAPIMLLVAAQGLFQTRTFLQSLSAKRAARVEA